MANSDDSGGGSIFSPARIIQNLFVETDFESQAHTDMEGMIAAADPEKTQRLGEKLVAAASVIEDIGMELKGRKDKVDWEGEGADSFRTWVTQMSSATLRLAEMSKGAGDWMQTSAQTLREVKKDMPKYSESSKATLDQYLGHNPGGLLTLGSRQPDSPSSSSVLAGPSQGQAYDASQKLADDHGEAVRQMRKLAQSYSMSSMAIGGTEAPTFPPMPKDLMPPKPPQSVHSSESIGGSGADATPAASVGAASSTSGSVAAASTGQVDRQVGTEIAGGVAMPEAPAAPTGPANPALNGPTGPSNPGPVLGAPPVAPVTNPGMGRVAGSGPGTFNGKAMPGNGMGRMPGVPGQSGTGNPRAFGRMPGDHGNGIYGGRPGTPANAQAPRGLARGNVIGAEAAAHGQQNRGPMAGRPGMGMGPGGASQQGIVGGRSLASRPGGIVGSSQLRPGMPAGQPFTQGGAGLARGASNTGANAASAHGSNAGRGLVGGAQAGRPGETREDNGQRPDYLVEDEETWSQKNQRIAPPVIE
ncbi:WXG100 family type VII secretion target [Streptomyces albidus (ex Kaewkla and Franco 2022)]|uniref:WXG100 family type VII secretion target n=1 Tax=Streptomyces albidus (ex Kaewkla and Franco 2022) TaxID=722709 RepID=UPI0015EEA1A3|nr:hypothetical protein [Streptomyces albidus (ex Kaewkla and Franco 2022)]